jgi:hypothetical protein
VNIERINVFQILLSIFLFSNNKKQRNKNTHTQFQYKENGWLTVGSIDCDANGLQSSFLDIKRTVDSLHNTIEIKIKYKAGS